MATTLDDLRALGYTIGLAHGSVQVEQEALDAAKATADPQTVIEHTNVLTADTLQTIANVGKLPEDPAERLELAARIGAAALEMLTEHVQENVAFHERAVKIAKEMPDVWHITGPGFSGYLRCKLDGSGWDEENQAMLAALADPTAHAERSFQVDYPEAIDAANQLTAAGRDVTREPGADAFDVDGRTMTCTQVIDAAGKLP